MDWMWIRSRLRVAEWYLDGAVCASVAEVTHMYLLRARDAYAAAMTALEEASLSDEQRHELRERLQVLNIRLYAIERFPRRSPN
jgi:hypothetical protein